MKVIVDTCIWSLALRRQSSKLHPTTRELQTLIEESRVQMIGPIRQELFSGISLHTHFTRLKEHLSSFQDLTIKTEDYILAAEYFNTCRKKGVQGSFIDFLICALATQHNLSIFTEDNDFISYSKYLPIKLHLLHKT